MDERIAVIGAGFWGKNHVRDLTDIGKKILVCDLQEDRLKFCKENYGVRVTTDYKEVIDNKNIKAVTICTPNPTHYRLCKEFLEAGKNVLLEKPMTLDSKQAQELVDIAKRKKLVLNVDHIFRFNNALRKIKELQKEDYFGDIYVVKLRWTNKEDFEKEGRQIQDILFDLAPHPIDIINYIFEEIPDEISAIGIASQKKEEDSAFLNCKIGRTIINLELSWVVPKKIRDVMVVGSKRTAFVDCLNQTIEIYDDEKKETKKLNIKPSNPLKESLNTFLNCVFNNGKSPADGKVGTDVVKVIEMAKKSLKSGEVVRVN